MIDITKMWCCDFCYDEYKKGEIEHLEMNSYDWQFKLYHKTLRVCNKHLVEMYKLIKETLINEGMELP